MSDEISNDYKTSKKVKIIVEKVTTHPTAGACHIHTEGEEHIIDFEKCPENFCPSAYNSLFAPLKVIELGGRHPWDSEEGVTRVGCPDPDRTVVFKIVAEK